MDHVYDLAIIGAGPIGLETALYAAESELDFILLERTEPAAALHRWQDVKMFSPVSMNVSPLGIKATGLTPSDRCLTGGELKRRYFDIIAADQKIAPRLTTGFAVERMSRHTVGKAGLLGDPKRAEHPFVIMGFNADGVEQRFYARCVIDASGVYTNPNWLGNGGLPALGERAHRQRISYDLANLPDTTTVKRRNLVVGAGHSAVTVLQRLDQLAGHDTDVQVTWVTAQATHDAFPVQEDDPLPERKRMNQFARSLMTGNHAHIDHLGGYWVDAIAEQESALQVSLINSDGNQKTVTADHIYALVGYRPDRTMYEELQVHECYASAGPMKHAAALLASDAASDCTASLEASDDIYTNPEPNFYILGAKSYGRTSNFLISKGHDQIAAVFKLITGNPNLDHYRATQTA